MESTSTNFSRFFSSSLNSSSSISFIDIKTKVAPLLFQAFETVPHLDQILYIAMEGLSFSYYRDHLQTFSIFSNSSSSSSTINTYYIQHIDQDTGEAHGEPTKYNYSSINQNLILEALEFSYSYACNNTSLLGTNWTIIIDNNGHDPLFLNSGRVTRTNVISLGFSVTEITDFVLAHENNGDNQSLISMAWGTKDGRAIVQGIPNTRLVISNDTVSLESLDQNGNPNNGVEGTTIPCNNERFESSLNIQKNEYSIHCSTVDIMGTESVYVVAIPKNEVVSLDHHERYKKKGLALLIVMIFMILIALLSFLSMNARNAKREMRLRASLLKQMEATQQAERKNMNKTHAFAAANHDVRASLAGLTALIDMSFDLVQNGSELETNLKQMKGCTQDLLGLLNSILDTSKIEAGKMQLEEEEFDLSILLEDIVDLYYPMASNKGVDLILDPCDGSIIRYSRVKGDRGRLKQVLCNLLSNAVKFTNEGHIAVRARAQKPTSLHNSLMASSEKHGGFMERLSSCLFFKKRSDEEAGGDHESESMSHATQQTEACSVMDFIFEVDDTGKGIPKENYKSVFENYVQVKETALGVGGTGLGLGIVQSLVRLMHGDIEISEKDVGEKGTCFKFNILLNAYESITNPTPKQQQQEEEEQGSNERRPLPTLQSCSSGSSICSISPRLRIRSSSPKPEPSRVVMLIADEYRRNATQRFMESLGIKVMAPKRWQDLFHVLKKIKHKCLNSSSQSSSSHGSEYLSVSSTLSRRRGLPLSSMDANFDDSILCDGLVLVVVDTNAGPVFELWKMVSNFKRGLCNPCQVVWLDKKMLFKDLDRNLLDQKDIVLLKPFHGSRLFQVIRLLPEFGGGSSSSHNRSGKSLRDWNSSSSRYHSYHEGERKSENDGREIIQEGEDESCYKPLSDKKILVVDDNPLMRMIAFRTLIQLGAVIEQCENGQAAVQLVGDGLIKNFPNLPYDYILMDCQMPEMDGFEATREIRKIEKRYENVRIPIIALTAETDKMSIDAGMDFHLEKPIKRHNFLEAIRYINARKS
ncbi:hypothetical protein PIB30_091563 [Stylosanthes scabra]|uniref:histidine kinase n=1 Tax=Stylosanthes scabra TaxID=79078 RepID=A0ABU6VXT6_9FABA|nr:hypothetical protein [Stylosanthes scabra]